jgi:exosortase
LLTRLDAATETAAGAEQGMAVPVRMAWFAVYAAAISVWHADVLLALAEYSYANVAASHVLMIPFVSAALVFRDRDAIFERVPPVGVPRAAIAAVMCGVVAFARYGWLRGDPGDVLTTLTALVVLLWAAGFYSFFGAAAFRAAAFPLLFAMCMVPLPPPLLDGATELLRRGSAEVVAALFTLIRMPYYRDGDVFELAVGAIQIADECSGIRSSIALVLTAVLAGHIFLSSKRARAMLLAAALGITILKNGVRIVGLAWLATYVHPGFLTGRLHRDGGVVFFVFALVLLASALRLLQRVQPSARVAR